MPTSQHERKEQMRKLTISLARRIVSSLLAFRRPTPGGPIAFHQIAQPVVPRYLWPRESVFQPPRFALGIRAAPQVLFYFRGAE